MEKIKKLIISILVLSLVGCAGAPSRGGSAGNVFRSIITQQQREYQRQQNQKRYEQQRYEIRRQQEERQEEIRRRTIERQNEMYRYQQEQKRLRDLRYGQ